MHKTGYGCSKPYCNDRTLRRMVPGYFSRLRSPSHLLNRPQGRRHVLIDSIIPNRNYAGLRSSTPGCMAVRGSGMRTSLDQVKLGSSSSGGPMMFSAYYRPHIRVNIGNEIATDVPSLRSLSRVRKSVPGFSDAACTLRGPLFVSGEGVPCDWSARRLRKDHPEISSRMRRGNGMGEILRGPWTSRSRVTTSPCYAC